MGHLASSTEQEAFELYASRYWGAPHACTKRDYRGRVATSPTPISCDRSTRSNHDEHERPAALPASASTRPRILLCALYRDSAAANLLDNWHGDEPA